MIFLIDVRQCRWCKSHVFPKIIDDNIIFPDKCPNRSCRRSTWNKTDAQIMDAQLRSINALLVNHKDGDVERKRSYRINIKASLSRKKKQRRKKVACLKCELFFETDNLLHRHNLRRHLKDE